VYKKDELLWAASWLYRASRENKYLRHIIDNQGWSQAVTELSWDNKFVGAQTLLTQVLIFIFYYQLIKPYNKPIILLAITLVPSKEIRTHQFHLIFSRNFTVEKKT
jgi:predicted phosphatase